MKSQKFESLLNSVDERQSNFQNAFVSHSEILNHVIIHEWTDLKIQL